MLSHLIKVSDGTVYIKIQLDTNRLSRSYLYICANAYTYMYVTIIIRGKRCYQLESRGSWARLELGKKREKQCS